MSKLTISCEQGSFGERRPVSVLCYDLVGSTELLVSSDLEDFQELTIRFHRSVKSIVERHGGTIKDTAGDGGLAVFGLTRRGKDAASDTIEAALSIVDACAQLRDAGDGKKLHVRVGISSSPVVIDRVAGEFDLNSLTGIAPVVAARLQAVAAPDCVVVSQATRALSQRSHKFKSLGERSLKGLSEPIEVWEPSRHRRHRDRFRAFGSVTGNILGRAAECRLLAENWNEAVSGRGRVLFIEGDAGIGKSRLLHELREITRDRRHGLFEFQCLQSAVSNALHPLANAVTDALSESHKRLNRENIRVLLRRFGASDDQTADILSELLVPATSNALFPEFGQAQIQARLKYAVQGVLNLLCRRGPIVITVEDLHWADLMSLDAVAALAGLVSGLPILVAITSRQPPPEALSMARHGDRISLQPLTPQETREYWMHLVADVDKLGMMGDQLLHVATGGVPLFVEEISAWAVQAKADDIGQRNWAQLASKPNFEALLAERLGVLGYKQQIAQYAAVVGQNFDARLLHALALSGSEAEIDATLDTLESIGIVHRVRLGGHDLFGFRHSLIQEAIYDSLLRKTRKFVHQRIAEAVDRDLSCAPWMTKAAAARHAELGGLVSTAVRIYIAAGADSASRFALQDARQHCEHALQLLAQSRDDDRAPVDTLAAMRILGPIIINLEGARSPAAIALYNDGVKLVRNRPKAEQAEWFPIYWGWWFTGRTFAEQHDRAVAVMDDLSGVENSEIQLQARHCKWAIDFNLGFHASCLTAVDEGLLLYEDAGGGPQTQNLYGGHDPKVCGLAQRSLSLWLTGHYSQARAAMENARSWADRLGHAGSIAHAMDFEAMLNWYRRDVHALAAVTRRMTDFAQEHKLPAIAYKARLFDGWLLSHKGEVEAGLRLVQEALNALQAIETAEDMPVYLDIQAELCSRSGDAERALALLTAAIADARQSGHCHWLPQLQRHAGEILLGEAARFGEAVTMLEESLALAASQNAVPLLLDAWATLKTADPRRQLTEEHAALIADALVIEAREGPR